MRLSECLRAGLAGVALLTLNACGGNGEAPEPDEVAELDTPQTTIPDPQPVKTPQTPVVESDPEEDETQPRSGLVRREPCGGSQTCQRLGEVSVGHGAPGVQVYFDPERNDEIVQWSRTLGSVIECVEGGEALGDCVMASDAEETCKSEFTRLTSAADERAAFEAVFLMSGSPCRPEEEGVEP